MADLRLVSTRKCQLKPLVEGALFLLKALLGKNRLIDKNMVEPISGNRNDPKCRYRLR